MGELKSHVLRGQTLVEFAIVLPVFLLLSVVIFDLGRAVYYYSVVHNAAREAVRYGAVTPLTEPFIVTIDSAGMKQAAEDYAIGLRLNNSNFNYVGWGPPESINNYPNPTVKMTISYTFEPVTPFVNNLLPCGCGYITLIGEAVMRTEWLPVP